MKNGRLQKIIIIIIILNLDFFSFHIMWFCHVEELHGSKCIRLTHHGRSVDGCFTLTSWYGFDITRDHYCIPFNGGLMDEKEGWIEIKEWEGVHENVFVVVHEDVHVHVKLHALWLSSSSWKWMRKGGVPPMIGGGGSPAGIHGHYSCLMCMLRRFHW
jgi:hypothetical protein